jgi:copper(I)-binding protein
VLIPVLAAVASLALLTGCGAGFNSQSTQSYAPADGVLADNGSIRALNALVVAGEGSTTGVISMTLANHRDRADRLTGITSDDGTVDLTGSGNLPAGAAVRFGAGTAPSATISDLTRSPGDAVTLKLTFARSEPITVRTLVVPASGDYAGLTPGPETPAPETPSASESAASSESPSASPSPSSS